MRTKANVAIHCWAIAVLMLAVAGCTSFYSGDETRRQELTDMEQQFISAEYELVYRIKALPEALTTILFQRAPGIVNPGEPFNSSDVMDPALSSTQITWAGISKDIVFVLYKQGGIAPHQRLLITGLRAGQIVSSIEFVVPYYIDDLASLKRFVQSGRAIIIKANTS